MSALATVVDPGTRGEAIPIVVDRDAALLAMLRRGHPHAPAQLVAQFGARAYRLAVGITRNAEDAEEAVQDAFLNVIRKIDLFRGESALRSWIYRTVANAAYQKRRTPASRHIHISIDVARPVVDEDGRHAESVVDWSSTVDDPARQAELRLALTAALGDLPADFHTAVLLRDVEGWSNGEIAETLGISVAAVKTRVHRARLFFTGNDWPWRSVREG